MKEIYNTLMEYAASLPVINTHSHHYAEEFHREMSLSKLLQNGYMGEYAENLDTPEGRETFISKMKYNSFFVWLSQALTRIYGIENPISMEQWENTDRALREAYQEKGYDIELMQKDCNYRKVIVDAFWNPGEETVCPELMERTYRINMYLFGYSKTAVDHNGNNPFVKNDWMGIAFFDQYLLEMEYEIKKRAEAGFVALKSALAYDIGLDFRPVSRERAEKAFLNSHATEEEIRDFQNYVFYEICRLAAKYDLPLQCHTGLGRLDKTSARYMTKVIMDNPKTKFVLFHGSYPWMDDLCALAFSMQNVYIDFCWLPTISTSAAERMLEEVIEIGDITQIAWGCDTWISEDSLAALLAMRHAASWTLAKKVEEGYLELEGAKDILRKLFYENAERLYLKR